MIKGIKNTADLRELLLEAIDGVRKNKIDHRQAQAISGLSSRILQSARLDFDVMKLTTDSKEPNKSVMLITDKSKQKKLYARRN